LNHSHDFLRTTALPDSETEILTTLWLTHQERVHGRGSGAGEQMRARRGESLAKPLSDDPSAEKAEKLANRCVFVRSLPAVRRNAFPLYKIAFQNSSDDDAKHAFLFA
jgi:hypothetical protein